MNRDFVEILSALTAAHVDFLVVGAHALAAHGVPRATGDLDLWVRPTAENAERVLTALRAFGAPVANLTRDDLTAPETVYQISVPPCRVDVMTTLTQLTFAEAWGGRLMVELEGQAVPVLGRDDLMRNKRALGRPQDLADVARLEQVGG